MLADMFSCPRTLTFRPHLFLMKQADAFSPAGVSPMLRRGTLKATSPRTPRMAVDDKTGIADGLHILHVV